MNDENKDVKAAALVVSDSRQLATCSASLVKRGLQGLADKRRKRIVKIDDEEAILEVTVNILTAEGYEVRSTMHPSEAIALVTEFQPDVALVDLVMPEIDGVALSQHLSKQFPRLKIVLTGVWIVDRVFEEMISSLFDAGIICDTLEAPFERQDLINMASDWVRGLYHFDPDTGLRDAKHFNMAVGGLACFHKSAACAFIELLQSGSWQMEEENCELLADFLRELSAMLRWFAGNGRAYRCELNKFAVLLPGASKDETSAKSADLAKRLNQLLNAHKLDQRFSAAIEVVAIPDAASVRDGRTI